MHLKRTPMAATGGAQLIKLFIVGTYLPFIII